MKKKYYRRLWALLAATAFIAAVGSYMPGVKEVGTRYLVGATDYLLVYVDNPAVSLPVATPPSSGGGGGVVTQPTTSTATSTTTVTSGCGKLKGDINCDGKVNIIDFSILAYWYKRTLTPQAIAQGVDLNRDGKVTLADFSIMAYYWTK